MSDSSNTPIVPIVPIVPIALIVCPISNPIVVPDSGPSSDVRLDQAPHAPHCSEHVLERILALCVLNVPVTW